MIRTKRVYDAPSSEDGRRILVDRLWPRGLTREAARLDEWRRDLAPSPELRVWFGHDPAKFDRFRRRYREELRPQRATLTSLAAESRAGTVTLVYGARDGRHCNAAVLQELLEEILRGGPEATVPVLAPTRSLRRDRSGASSSRASRRRPPRPAP